MATKKQFRVVTGMDHERGRQEPGEIYKGPLKSVDWLLEQGHIEPADAEEAD